MSEFGWESDTVVTRDGAVIPVRRTAQRPTWAEQPSEFRSFVESCLDGRVVADWSAGTGFTPGFASRLDLADGRRVFVKAASSYDDEFNGFGLSDSYRDEVRKLNALPAGIGAPPLLWWRDEEVGGLRWVVLCFAYVDGVPPRRPWHARELDLVCAKVGEIADRLTGVTVPIELGTAIDLLCEPLPRQLRALRDAGHDPDWCATIERLCDGVEDTLRGDTILHLDLRDDNVLIDRDDEVWVVDWNWPARGAKWLDLIVILISAAGDGLDADAIVATHPLTAGVDPHHVDQALALLWPFWQVAKGNAAPPRSPHLRSHQAWYADATRGWLERRLAGRD